jgi:hypothetical protein
MKMLLYGIVCLHFLIAIVGGVAIVQIIANEPWYLSLPITILIVNLALGDCPCTELENTVRRKLGLPEIIKRFLSHYLDWRNWKT